MSKISVDLTKLDAPKRQNFLESLKQAIILLNSHDVKLYIKRRNQRSK